MLFIVVKNAFKLSNASHKRKKNQFGLSRGIKPTFEKHIQLYKYCVLKLFIPQT